MRFPNDPFPPPVAPVDPTEVSPNAAISAVRRIGDGARGSSAHVVGGSPAHVGGGSVTEEPERHPYHDRDGVDRRKMCRRIYHIPVMLDTRSGDDRRKDTRRPDDVPTHMDREI